MWSCTVEQADLHLYSLINPPAAKQAAGVAYYLERKAEIRRIQTHQTALTA